MQRVQDPVSRCNNPPLFLARLRETNKLRIPRSAIGPYPILCKSSFREDPPRLVEVHSPVFHNLLDLALAVDVEAAPGVTGCDVGAEVEIGGGEARLDI